MLGEQGDPDDVPGRVDRPQGLDDRSGPASRDGSTAAPNPGGDVVLEAVGLAGPAPHTGVLRRRRAPAHPIHDLDLTVRSGEVLGVVGDDRSGVAQLGALLTGSSPVTSGTIALDGVDVTRPGRRQRVELYGQRALVDLGGGVDRGADGAPDGVDEAAEAGAQHAGGLAAEGLPDAPGDRHGDDAAGEDAESTKVLADELQAAVGDPPRKGAVPSPLRLLVLDAASAALAPTAAAVDPDPAVLGALVRHARSHGLACVLLDRDVQRAASFADRVLVLCEGLVVEELDAGSGPIEALHPYTAALVDLRAPVDVRDRPTTGAPPEGSSLPAPSPREAGSAVPAGRTAAATSGDPAPGSGRREARADGLGAGGCVYRARCLAAQDRCARERPELTRPLGATHRVACHFPLEPAGQAVVIPDGQVPSDAVLVVERTSEPTAREFARD